MTRNKLPFEVHWLLVDQAHASTADLLASTAALSKARLPRTRPSVNAGRTQALIKVVGPLDGIAPGGPVLRIFDEKDHHEALALVLAEDW